MLEQAILFPSLQAVSLIEILVVFLIACGTYFIFFSNFEKHLPAQRRLTKLLMLVGVLSIIGILFGRYAFWGVIALMTIGQIYLHGVYFPRHGINGFSAEPYDKYLETIERMKGKKL